jgi:hypothetical protein
MRSWISRMWAGEWGVYLRYMSTLLLVVAGVFSYFSVTGCDGGGVGGGCGTSVPIGSYSSDLTVGRSVAPPPYSLSLSGTGAAAAEAETVAPSSAVLPGSEVIRYISYTTAAGKDPTRIEWTPPPGSSGFAFSAPPTNPPGPAPYVFDNEPPLAMPLLITYSAPLLFTNTTTLVVGEVLVGLRVSETDDIRVLNYTISAAASRAEAAPAPGFSAPMMARIEAPAAPISALEVQRWYGAPGITMTTELCQQTYDWLQSDRTFIATRMPVSAGGAGNPSYELPVLFPVDSNASPTLITARPKLNIKANGLAIPGLPDLPLEVRSDRIAFMENQLPPAAGEHWVALGVAREPKITCPASLSKPAWEFNYVFPVNPATPINTLPMYFCQDGQDPPPIDIPGSSLLASAAYANSAPAVQMEGITCLGPQEHVLLQPVIYVGNASTVWNVFPADEVRLKHYVQVIGLAPTIRFLINSDAAGFGWRLYEGSDSAPNISREVDITKPYTASPGLMFFWPVGTVPTGTVPGSHNFTLRVEKSDDPSKYGSATDMIWVGQWTPPPTPGGAKHYIYLPLITRQ